jgi:hypothetical protein
MSVSVWPWALASVSGYGVWYPAARVSPAGITRRARGPMAALNGVRSM